MSDQDEKATRELPLTTQSRWSLTEKQRNEIIARLRSIVKKRTVIIITKDGPQESEETADKNAIAACRVLADLESQNQRDDERAAETLSASATGIELDRPIVLMLPANSRGEMPR